MKRSQQAFWAATGALLVLVTGVALANPPAPNSRERALLDAGTVSTQETGGDCGGDPGGDPCTRLNGCAGATACVNGIIKCLCSGEGTRPCTACGVAGVEQCSEMCLPVPGTCVATASCNPNSCTIGGSKTCNASTNVWSGCTGCQGSTSCSTLECGEPSSATCDSNCGVSVCAPVTERCNQCDDSPVGSTGRGKVDEGLHCPTCEF